jgi:CRISPR-associated protein Cmr2
MNGEREWLTLAEKIPDDIRPADLPKDARYLDLPPGRRGDGKGQVPTIWTRLSKERPSWVKPGEHLDALAAIKRLWPTLYTDEVRDIVGEDVRRYVVSTHTMALAVSLEQWLDKTPRPDMPATLRNLLGSKETSLTALPRRIASRLYDDADARLLCRKLPGVLDALKEERDADARNEQDRQRVRQAEEMLASTERDMQTLFGAKPEAYYGLLLLDGDRMGAWLAGATWKEADGRLNDPRLTYERCWHPQIRESAAVRGLRERNPALDAYLKIKRPPSPGRHGSISEALNQFSLKTARFVVEDCFKGKLIYAGGDDVLAFVCVDDLLPAMTLLRCLYSGLAMPEWIEKRLREKNPDWFNDQKPERNKFASNNGWLRLDGELLLTMGDKATASCGAVVVHHQAPLGMVLRTLREAESTAKKQGGRDAFSITVIKRSGGALRLTEKWGEPVALLGALRAFLADPDTSRRAVYNSLEWLVDLPDPKGTPEMLASLLGYQFDRQIAPKERERVRDKHKISCLAKRLAKLAADQPKGGLKWLENFLTVAEFLARETRSGGAA